MARMEQSALNSLYNSFRTGNYTYKNKTEDEFRKLTNWFNMYWVSNYSYDTLSQLERIVNNFSNAASRSVSTLNRVIKQQVITYNLNPQNRKKLFYRGIALSMPDLNNAKYMHDTLPSGSRGFDDVNGDIKRPFNDLNESLQNIKLVLNNMVKGSNALNGSEKAIVTNTVNQAYRDAVRRIENIESQVSKKQSNLKNKINDTLRIYVK